MVEDDDDVFVFVVVLSQTPSITSLVKIGSVIDEMLLLLLLYKNLETVSECNLLQRSQKGQSRQKVLSVH